MYYYNYIFGLQLMESNQGFLLHQYCVKWEAIKKTTVDISFFIDFDYKKKYKSVQFEY